MGITTEGRICSCCKQWKTIEHFYKHEKQGLQNWCKDCKRTYEKEYSKRPEAIESQRRTYERLRDKGYFRDWKKKQYRTPQLQAKMAARRITSLMIKNGEIEKLSCAGCGKFESEGHHPDYNQPLLIVWLCHACHMALHNKIKESKDALLS